MEKMKQRHLECVCVPVCVCDEVHLLVVVLVWMIPSVNTHTCTYTR